MKTVRARNNVVLVILCCILLVLSLVLWNWDQISKTKTVQTKLKIFESIQSNELDSAKIILKDYIDSF